MTAPPSPRRSRLGLYAPLLLLALVAAGWSIAWFVIRDRVVSGLDGWVAAEAAAGRTWTCPDRQVGGFPFRIEVTCPTLGLTRPDLAATLGRTTVVSQVYRPDHLIAETPGPFAVQVGPDRIDAAWTLLQASVILTPGQQRAALVIDAPRFDVRSEALGAFALPARRLELHVRPDPADPRTADVALATMGSVIPGLDLAVGGAEPADLDLVTTISQFSDLPARPLPSEFERWRAAGGAIRIARFALAKGPRRLEATGSLGLDDLHRPTGQLDAAARGLEGVLGRFLGDRSAAGLLGAILGGGRTEARATDPAAPPLRPLPPLRAENGRLLVGPVVVPGLRLPPLY